MDRLDRQIVHCLLVDGRASYERIGRVVGVSPQTVARRLHGLLEADAVRVVATPAPTATGSETWLVNLLCRPGTVERLGRDLARRPEASWVSVVSGGAGIICALRVDRRSTSRGTPLLDRLPGVEQIVRFDAVHALHRFHTPRANWAAFLDRPAETDLEALADATGDTGRTAAVELTGADGPLLDRLAIDGRSTIAELARATGWSAARTRSRLHELLRSRALRIETELQPSAFGAHASAFLWIAVVPGRLHEVGSAIADHAEVGYAVATTGRANLLAAVSTTDSETLYEYLHGRLGVIDAVRSVDVVPVLFRMKHSDHRASDALAHRAS